MYHKALESGLKMRGFVGIENIDSMGYCHKNEKHYLLRTDGLLIYTTYRFTHSPPPSPKDYYVSWDAEDFTFEKLDEAISIAEL